MRRRGGEWREWSVTIPCFCQMIQSGERKRRAFFLSTTRYLSPSLRCSVRASFALADFLHNGHFQLPHARVTACGIALRSLKSLQVAENLRVLEFDESPKGLWQKENGVKKEGPPQSHHSGKRQSVGVGKLASDG